eukprot:2577464-Pyramimonas_sp.AAC.1
MALPRVRRGKSFNARFPRKPRCRTSFNRLPSQGLVAGSPSTFGPSSLIKGYVAGASSTPILPE